MKKALILILAVCMTASAACAEVNQIMMIKYNSCASVFSAPMLDTTKMKSNGTIVTFDIPPLFIGFELDGNAVKSGAVYAKDDTCAADFLASCMAMIYYLGDLDYAAIGIMLQQYMDIRKGDESTMYYIGRDVFQIITNEDYKFCMVYLNNDLKSY